MKNSILWTVSSCGFAPVDIEALFSLPCVPYSISFCQVPQLSETAVQGVQSVSGHKE